MDIKGLQDATLNSLSGKINDYYLAGGTALARFYFNHRESADLDFFTQKFSSFEISKIMEGLATQLNLKITLAASQNDEKYAKIMVYYANFPEAGKLKIDFVEDVVKLLKPLNLVNGINIMSIEDIYLRKLYAISGAVQQTDGIGRSFQLGGRVEAKDFFDVLFLSNTFLPLSDFVQKYGNNIIKEGLIRWFRRYDRMEMKTGLLEIITKNSIDYQKAEKYFKNEIDKIIEEEIGG
jgi:predicted nucleotidyltransferase component of viral defense system